SLMSRSRLVPRVIPVLGLIGGPLLIAAVIATLFGQHSSLTGLAALPVILVAAWEFSLGVWLGVEGFKPSPITTRRPRGATPLGEGGAPVKPRPTRPAPPCSHGAG